MVVVGHAAGGTARGDGTKGGDIAKHLGQGHHCLHQTGTGTGGVHSFYLSTALVEVTDYITHVLFGSDNLQLHDGLHQYGLGLGTSAFIGLEGANLERQLVGVNGMEATVQQFHLEAVHGETTEDTTLHGRLKALLYGGNEFLGNVTASHLVLELQATSLVVFIHRTYIDNDIGKLTAATRLLLVHLTEVDSLGDGFLIVHLGLALVTLYLELTTQTVDDDVEVKLTHTGDNRLSALLVGLDCEGGVLLCQLGQAIGQFVEVLLGLGLYGDTDNGIGEVH